jgi:hypothetical protein
MITLAEAKTLKRGDVLILAPLFPGDKVTRWRVNGKVKTWKRDPSRVYIPLKRGLYEHGHLHEGNLGYFTKEKS